jgi:hypothetical protein
MIQATIWAGREHCEDLVLVGLRALQPVHDEPIDRLWVVYGEEQRKRLAEKSQGLAVQWVTLDRQPQPQICTDREVKRLECAYGFNALLTALAGSPRGAAVLLVDDDIVPPADAVARLRATGQALGAAAVSGLTRCNDGGLPIFKFSGAGRVTVAPVKPQVIDGIGTFCMYLTPAVIAAMAYYWPADKFKVGPAAFAGHDLHLCRWLQTRGFKVAVDPSVDCLHNVRNNRGRVTSKRWRNVERQ